MSTKLLNWSTALERYETHLRARRSAAGTIESYLRELKKLAGRFELRVKRPTPAEVTTEDLRGYVCDLMTGDRANEVAPISPRTAARVVSQFRSFFGFLLDEGLATSDPTRRLEY